MHYKRIMVAVDGSDTSYTALLEAVEVCKTLQATLCILSVIDVFPISNLSLGADFERCREIMREDGESILSRMHDLAKEHEVIAEIKLIEIIHVPKTVSEKIIAAATSWRADLLVMGTHGKRGFRRLLLGSVAEETLRMSPVPILLIRSTESGAEERNHFPCKRIIVAIDGSAVSHLVLKLAIALTKAFKASLSILHVAYAFPSKNFIFSNQFAKYEEAAKAEGEKIVAAAHQFTSDHAITPEKILIDLTDPAQTIAEKINEAITTTKADLLVIGTHGYRGMNRLLLGSVAEEAVRTSHVPVLIIRGMDS